MLTQKVFFYKDVSKSLSHVDQLNRKLVSLCWNKEGESNSTTEIVRLPIPYQLPPPPYTSQGPLFLYLFFKSAQYTLYYWPLPGS
jgi:hypothetical protein